MGAIIKLVTWVLANGASIVAALQAIIKAGKELVTAVLNLLSLLMPNETHEALVEKARALFNVIDAGLEFIKKWLLRQ